MPKYALLPIEQLLEPEIPAREAFDEVKLAELRDSVKELGFIHPLAVVNVVEKASSGEGQGRGARTKRSRLAPARYEIVDGHRRYKVGVMLSQKVLPCLIFDDPENAREAIKLHTALFREDLSTAEEAAFIADLIERYDYTEEQLCRALRQKPSWINERLGILRGNPAVFDALRARSINLAVAKQLNRVKDDAQTKYFLALVIDGGATALTVSKWVSEWLTKKTSTPQVEQVAQSQSTSDSSAPAGPTCFCCGKQDVAYNLEMVWIHSWEKKMFEAQLERAAQVRPDELGAPGYRNGGENSNA